MTPSPWHALILALGAFRLLRFAAWDVWPPVARARAWLIGEEVLNSASTNARLGTTAERVEHRFVYRRPILAELFHCPYCLGAWICAAVYVCWVLEPRWTLYAAVPAAGSALVGAWSRWIDP